MATRLLLTMLAVLTGLAAQFTPAQARIRAEGAAAVGTLAAAAQSERAASARLSAPARPAHRLFTRDNCTVAMMRDVAPCVLPVLQGIDRARE